MNSGWTPPPLKPVRVAVDTTTRTGSPSAAAASLYSGSQDPRALWPTGPLSETSEPSPPSQDTAGADPEGPEVAAAWPAGLCLPPPPMPSAPPADGGGPAAMPPWQRATKHPADRALMDEARATLAAAGPAAAAWLGAPARAHFRLSDLAVDGQTRLTLTSSLAQGGYGKFRLGLASEAGAVPVAVKESRLGDRRRLDGHKRAGKRGPRTHFTELDALVWELRAATVLGGRRRPREIFDVDGKIYVTSELLPCTLSTAIRRLAALAPPARERAALCVFAAGCRILSHLHAKRWLHGDIKPANLFLTHLGELELGDCGIAREVGDNGWVEPPAFTFAYAAPELFASGGATATSDIWSLGVTCLEVAAPELCLGVERPRGPPAFGASLAHIGGALPHFADLLVGRVLVGDAEARAGAQEGLAWAQATPERRAQIDQGQATLAAVADPEPAVAMGQGLLAAHRRARLPPGGERP